MNIIRPFITPIVCLAVTTLVAAVGCKENPESVRATHLQRGQAYMTEQKYQEAVIEFRNILQIDPNDAGVHYQLALAYMKLGGRPNLAAAFVELNKTLDLDKTHADAHLKLAELYLTN